MKLRRFGLGVRFDLVNMAQDVDVRRLVFDEILSVLTLGQVKELSVYGGMDPTAEPGENVYLAVLTGGKLKVMRRVYDALCEDAAVGMYLCHRRPFLENNRLEKIEGLTYFGDIGKDGRLYGGEETLDVTVSGKRGRKRSVGQGIHMLVAPAAFGSITPMEAIKRITFCARAYFPGVRILPFPITPTSPVQALLTACNGSQRTVKTGAAAGMTYAVLRGKTAIIEAAQDGEATGELLRRALDEGLTEIYIAPCAPQDDGLACARALGVRFFDAEGQEVREGASRVVTVDAELLHPLAAHTRFILMGGPEATLGAALTPLLHMRRQSAVEAMLSAAEFDKMLTGKALVLTGGENILDGMAAQTVQAVLAHCAPYNIPVVALAGGTWEDPSYVRYYPGSTSIVKVPVTRDMPPEAALKCFDDVAERIFRFVRLGRDVEKIGAPKREKKRLRYLPGALRRRLEKQPPLDLDAWANEE